MRLFYCELFVGAYIQRNELEIYHSIKIQNDGDGTQTRKYVRYEGAEVNSQTKEVCIVFTSASMFMESCSNAVLRGSDNREADSMSTERTGGPHILP